MASISSTKADALHSVRGRTVSQLSSFVWTLDRVACWLVTAAIVFLMGADFRGDTGGDFQVHWQIYLRLLVAAVAGGIGTLLLFPKTYRDFLCFPGILLVGYAGWYLATLPFSIAKGYSAAAWVSLAGVLLFIPAAMRVLGGFRLLTAIATGLVAFLVGSWFAYLFVPEIGVFNEQVTQTEVFERMGGLAHPNELGMYAAFTTVLFAGLGVSRRLSWSFAFLGMLLGIVTLIGCFSRTSMVVCAVGLAVTLQGQWRLRSNLTGISLGIGLASFGLLIAFGTGQLDWLIEDALRKLTKTGSTDELATATGRTEIWSYAISQIAESPLYGYGYCSARFVMEEHSYHCHNIVLNALMFGGIVSGLIVAAMCVYLLSGILFNPRPEIDGLASILLAGGMVEGLLGAPSPAAAIFLWFMLIFWRQLDMQVATQVPEVPIYRSS
jgi:exopolysaccharide production protein ExoQ